MNKDLIEKDGYFRIGKIRAPHGIRGELYLISFTKQFDWLHELSEARLVTKEQNEEDEWVETVHSFKILKSKKHKVGQILCLEGISSRTQAEVFIGAQLEVPVELFSSTKEDGSYYLRAVKDFMITDQDNKPIGPVVGFSNNGAHDLIVIKHKDSDLSIPYVDNFIIKKNFKEKWIRMQIPEGLLEV